MTNKDPQYLTTIAYASSLALLLPWFGFFIFIALIGVPIMLNLNKGNEFISQHLRQQLGIGLLYVLLHAITNTIAPIFIHFMVVGLIIALSALGFTNAQKGKPYYLPVIGKQLDSWFKFIK